MVNSLINFNRPGRARRHPPQVAAMANTASAMTAVASHPMILVQPRTANRPITSGLAAKTMIMAMTGTAVMPFRTALQKRALMGSTGVKVMAVPRSVAAARTP